MWNGAVLAESDDTVVVEGNHYFPPSALKTEYLEPTSSTSICPWKGTAEYFSVVVDGRENRNAAWVYKEPSEAAAAIKGYVAFWRGVAVEG